MSLSFSLVMFFAGLGVFLYGMHQLENGLKALSSESFKALLRKSTGNPVSSVAGGIVTTMILQSSSMVGLIMMAFVGAGVIPLVNAVGVVMGANLGTTFTGWVVATLGFKLKLAQIAIPAIGIGGLMAVALEQRQTLKSWAELIMGLGLLLFGLDIMKDSMEALAQRFDIAVLQGYHAIVYLLVGVLFSAVIQSSSAAMMITLSALHAGIVPLEAAAALVVGADLGTTSTMILGSLGGNAVKKQLALAHVLFNLLTAVFAFLALPWLLALVQSGFGFQEPVLALVAFHSTFNLIGLCLIIPFLGLLSRFLERRFVDPVQDVRTYIQNVPTSMVTEAMLALGKEVECLLVRVSALNLRSLKIAPEKLAVDTETQQRIKHSFPAEQTYLDSYADIKQLEEAMLQYANEVLAGSVTEQQANEIHSLLIAARHGVYAAKALKDIRENLVALRHAKPARFKQFYQQQITGYCADLKSVLVLLKEKQEPAALRETIASLKLSNRNTHDVIERDLFRMNEDDAEVRVSTLLNVNREFRACTHNLLEAVNYLKLG